jgi:hypothetical protein
MSRNPLLETHLSIWEWLRRLPSVSAKLYEVDADAWASFEPARLKLERTVRYLEYESYIDAERDTPQAVMKKLPEHFEKHQWEDVARIAAFALGHSALIQIIERGGEASPGLATPKKRAPRV